MTDLPIRVATIAAMLTLAFMWRYGTTPSPNRKAELKVSPIPRRPRPPRGWSSIRPPEAWFVGPYQELRWATAQGPPKPPPAKYPCPPTLGPNELFAPECPGDGWYDVTTMGEMSGLPMRRWAQGHKG